MLHHSLWGAVVFLSLLYFIAPALDLMPCLPSSRREEAIRTTRKEQLITAMKKNLNSNVSCISFCWPKANLSNIQYVSRRHALRGLSTYIIRCVFGVFKKIENFIFFTQTRHLRSKLRSNGNQAYAVSIINLRVIHPPNFVPNFHLESFSAYNGDLKWYQMVESRGLPNVLVFKCDMNSSKNPTFNGKK